MEFLSTGDITRSVDLEAGVCEIKVADALGRGWADSIVWISSNDQALKSWVLTANDSRALIERRAPLSPGLFRALLKPGAYNVSVACFGFQERLIENVIIGNGRTTSMDVSLDLE